MRIVEKDKTAFAARAEEFVRGLKPDPDKATVVALTGDLGAGKTTFIQGAAAALGVDERVASPTFVIQRVYDLEDQPFTKFVHIDAYRLDSTDELSVLGWETMLSNPGNLVFIEWADRIRDALPPHTRWLQFRFIDAHTREITYDSEENTEKEQ